MNKYYILIAVLPLICFTGCDLLRSNNTPYIQIQTEKNHYNVKEDESVEVTIVNKSLRVLHYSTCMSKILEIVDKDNSVIETHGFPVCHCICAAELKPGETIPSQISSVALRHYFASSSLATGPVSYRIRYDLYLDNAFGDHPVPAKNSRSNTFTLTGLEE